MSATPRYTWYRNAPGYLNTWLQSDGTFGPKPGVVFDDPTAARKALGTILHPALVDRFQMRVARIWPEVAP